jgi:hypothetical protein
MSDRRLRALLKQLREAPAAPQDFRARVLGRLADDGLLPSHAAPRLGWIGRLPRWLKPAPLGLAACGALALALVMRQVPRQAVAPASLPAQGLAMAPLAGPAPALHPKDRPKAAMAAKPQAPQPAQVPAPDVALAPQPVQVQAPEALGAAAAPKSQELVHVAEVAASPTPSGPGVSKPYPDASSEVRNNVVRVSQGQFADVHFSYVTPGHVRVDILDRLGRQVAVLFDGIPQYGPGEYDGNGAPGAFSCPWCLWNNLSVYGDMAASGIYLVRVQTPDYVHIHKLMLIK